MVEQHGFDNAGELDFLIVPGGTDPEYHASEAEKAFVRAQLPRVQALLGICTGAFVLAEAGLLRAESQEELGELPLGGWVQLEGRGPGGPLYLSLCAQQLALSISEWTWNGLSLLSNTKKQPPEH